MTSWREPWTSTREEVLRRYGGEVGRRIEELATPSLIVDVGLLESNLHTMATGMADAGTALRPHAKVQKSPDLALRQMELGAVGITVATVWEACALAAAGITDILIANQFVGREKMATAARLAHHATLTVVADDIRLLDEMSAAAVAANSELNVLVDIDVGMGRCGARSPQEALAVALHADSLPRLTLRGIQAYEGHCMLEPDPTTRLRLATRAIDYAAEVSALVQRHLPDAVTLSGGGTGTYNITGLHPAVTELQAGSYVFMDAFHAGLVNGFAVSMTVLSSVVARHGGTVIFDAGRKAVGVDYVDPYLSDYPTLARAFAEEHALFDVDDSVPLKIGDRGQLVPGYAPTTVNLHDVLFLARDGVIVEIWPIFPRGSGHHGFLDSLAAS
jgi:D-serine deaminase-like pyridoxal phosphate-dependent protein